MSERIWGNVSRICLGHVRYAETGASSLATIAGGALPAGALACTIQADGATVRVSQDPAVTPSATVGVKLADGAIYEVNSILGAVQVYVPSGAVQVTFFDRA